MEYTVAVFKQVTSASAEIWVVVKADDAITAAFSVMHQLGVREAFHVLVGDASGDTVAEFVDVVCSEVE